MLTRLKINGFKNLHDVDLRLGFFTCIAGANGVGKSNLFDAICFLSNLASKQIVEAASLVRGTNEQLTDIKSLFSFDAQGRAIPMEFVVEAITSKEVIDDFERTGNASATYLEYSLTLCLADSENAKDPVYIQQEQLKRKSKHQAVNELGFTTSDDFIQKFIVDSKPKRTTLFIGTSDEADTPIIKLYGEEGRRGAALKIPAKRTPQTVLSSINSVSHPTALALRREMQSWQLLQLEPSALREPDDFASSAKVTANGRHLAAALYRTGLYADVAASLSSLISGIDSVEVDSNEIRKLRTLLVRMSGEPYTASALSDGTLRFLALAIMACDPDAQGLTCMEEPENGIHPLRIPQIVELVRQLSDALDEEEKSWDDVTKLRQVIINTHSPLVVAELPIDELLMAESFQFKKAQWVRFKPIKDSWRGKYGVNNNAGVSKGQIIAYLNGQSLTAKPNTVRAWIGDKNTHQLTLL